MITAEVEIDIQPESRTRSRDLESQIGNTPLLRLRRVARGLPLSVEIFVKAEHLNPGGSVKDRAALSIILDGERSGRLYPGKIILDATSGNTGIAYAMLGAARGYPVTICLPANASVERKRILQLHGAEIIETDRTQGSDGAPPRGGIAREEPAPRVVPGGRRLRRDHGVRAQAPRGG
jgi:cysteine synthase B